MKNSITLILLGLLISPLVFAESGGAGNGGDAIVCPDREVKAILLDSYEARVKRKLTLDLSNPNIQTQTWRSMVNVAVKRLEKLDVYTASVLYDYSMEMVNDFEKFQMYPDAPGKNVYLGDDVNTKVNDSLHISTPADCEEDPRQMVIQIQPKFRLDLRYHFNKTLWDQLTQLDQAMTILHEAWYRIMLENGAKDSRAARYMNGLIASKQFEQYSFGEYLEDLKATELENYIIVNRSEAVRSTEIKLNLKEHDFVTEGAEVCAPRYKINMSLKETYTLLNRRQKYLTNVKYQKVCFKNSTLTRVVLPIKVANSDVTLRLPFHQVKLDGNTNGSPTIHFNDSGKLSHLTGLKFSSLMEMYYECGGERSYVKKDGCEAGPFIDHDTKVKNPSEISFDEDEKPIGYFNR